MFPGRRAETSLGLAAVQGFQFYLDLVRDKAVRPIWDARKICNGALGGIASESAGTARIRRLLRQTRAKISLCWVTSTAWSRRKNGSMPNLNSLMKTVAA